MKFYIATGLANHAAHNAVRDALAALGHEITYDWTTHGPVWRQGKAVIRTTSVAETDGVRAADFVVVLLPGGRGTHAELGMALAFGKPTLIACGDAAMFEASPETCAFYHHPRAVPLVSIDPLEIATNADIAAAELDRCLFISNDGETRCNVQRSRHAGMSKLHSFDGPRERAGRVKRSA